MPDVSPLFWPPHPRPSGVHSTPLPHPRLSGVHSTPLPHPRLSGEGRNPETVWDGNATNGKRFWIPAFAGKTGGGAPKRRRKDGDRQRRKDPHSPRRDINAMPDSLYYGDNLQVLREHVPAQSVDLVYLDPPFNSNASYNVLFREKSGEDSPRPNQGFHRYLGVDPGDRIHLRNGHHPGPRRSGRGQGNGRRLPPVRRAQRHDGLPGDDGPPPGGVAPRPETHGQPVPALRPHGQPLFEDCCWMRYSVPENFKN